MMVSLKFLKVGKKIWISRFSPTAFKTVSNEENETNGYQNPLKNDIFIRPFRAVITQFYSIGRTRDKWVLLIQPSAMSWDNWAWKPCEKNRLVPFVGSASLLDNGFAGFKQIELEVQVKNGKVVMVSNNYIISHKRNNIFKTNQQILRKFLKMFKKNHKYNQMNMITSCLLDVHTASQTEKMIQQNPENFI